MVIPWLVRLYEEIIHELKRMNYIPNRWTNHGIYSQPSLSRVSEGPFDFELTRVDCISYLPPDSTVDLAQYEIFRVKGSRL